VGREKGLLKPVSIYLYYSKREFMEEIALERKKTEASLYPKREKRTPFSGKGGKRCQKCPLP
jgi:hypothetical protein